MKTPMSDLSLLYTENNGQVTGVIFYVVLEDVCLSCVMSTRRIKVHIAFTSMSEAALHHVQAATLLIVAKRVTELSNL